MTGCSAWRSWRGVERNGFRVALAGTGVSKSVKPLTEIIRENVVFQQGDISCGSAAVATIMRHHFGDNVSERDVIDWIIGASDADRLEKIIRRGGLSLLDLKKYAVSRGYDAKGFRMEIDDLLGLDGPAIVPLVVAGSDHFVVVRGHSRERDRIHIADPSFGNRTMRLGNFVTAWKGNIVFIISNGHLPERPSLSKEKEDELYVDEHFVVRSVKGGIL